ncbi:MAG: YCF48-related protein [Bacteroidota bacterium]
MTSHKLLTLVLAFLCLAIRANAQDFVQRYPAEGTYDSNLFHIEFSDNGVGYILGDCGNILRSEDEGQSWQRLEAPEGANLSYLSVFPDGTGRQFMVGNTKKLYLTQDGGQSWTTTVPRDLGMSFIRSVSTPAPNTLYAADGIGMMLRSFDGGQNYSQLPIGSGNNNHAIHFTSKLRGIAYGQISKVLWTEDGGNSWEAANIEEVDDNDTQPIINVSFLDEKLGFLSTRDQVFRTIDGGKTWEIFKAYLPLSLLFDGILALDEQSFCLIKDNIFHWYSQGEEFLFPLPEKLQSFQRHALAQDPQGRIWLATDGKFLAFTIDKGQSWTLRPDKPRDPIFHLDFPNENEVVAFTNNGLILRSTNGGQDWRQEPLNLPNRCFLIRQLFSLNNGEYILECIDTKRYLYDGKDFRQLNLPPGIGFLRDFLASPDEKTWFIVVGGGRDWTIFRSQDKGISWRWLSDFPTTGGLSLVPVTEDILYVYGLFGLLAKSENGGINWERLDLSLESGNTLTGLYFAGPDNGLITGRFSSFRTTDGGKSFERIPGETEYNNTITSLRDVWWKELNPERGAKNWLYHSPDGGTTVKRFFPSCSVDAQTFWPNPHTGDLWLVKDAYSIYSLEKQQSISSFQNQKEKDFYLYPNPSSNFLNIEFFHPDLLPRRLQLLSASGQLIGDYLPSSTIRTSIDISGLPDGMYILRIFGEQDVQLESFLKTSVDP